MKDCTETKVDGGTMLTFTFNPFTFGKDAAATVEQKVVMYDGDHFMRKWIELKTTDTEARVKFIDGERLNVNKDDKTWTAPRDKGGIVSMEMDKSVLGQPVYINGMFFGCEFPEADTQIMDGLARSRYWTGKNFTDFQRDNQLTKDGEFVSWERSAEPRILMAATSQCNPDGLLLLHHVHLQAQRLPHSVQLLVR